MWFKKTKCFKCELDISESYNSDCAGCSERREKQKEINKLRQVELNKFWAEYFTNKAVDDAWEKNS